MMNNPPQQNEDDSQSIKVLSKPIFAYRSSLTDSYSYSRQHLSSLKVNYASHKPVGSVIPYKNINGDHSKSPQIAIAEFVLLFFKTVLISLSPYCRSQTVLGEIMQSSVILPEHPFSDVHRTRAIMSLDEEFIGCSSDRTDSKDLKTLFCTVNENIQFVFLFN